MEGSARGGRSVEALVSHGESTGHTAQDIGIFAPDPVRSVATRIKNFPDRETPARRRSFQETASWEGVVTQRTEEGVIAKLTRRYQDFPAEEAMIPWLEIDETDRPLAVEGALFSWKVGYLESNGTRLSVSRIEFRKVPGFSARERSAAQVKAQEYAALFND
jgi:hypothetical protein